MATERAGGLSTTAIARCIDNWETETQDGAEIPAAHAELAALVERAGRVGALAAALDRLVVDEWAGWGADPDADLWVCFYCGAKGAMEGSSDPPDHKLDCPLATARVLLADAGPGAAGARDETAARVSEAAWEYRRLWDEWEAGRHWVRFRRREEARAALWHALDALADAGGAGTGGGGDG